MSRVAVVRSVIALLAAVASGDCYFIIGLLIGQTNSIQTWRTLCLAARKWCAGTGLQ